MVDVRALLNDNNAQVYTNTAQLPYLNIAMRDLKTELELANVQVTNVTSAAITIPAGIDTIDKTTTPALPDDLVEIQQAWESLEGQQEYIPMTRREFLPRYLEGVTVGYLVYWSWIGEQFKVLPASINIDVKLDYIKDLLGPITTVTQPINVINCQPVLGYRTGALCARFIGENPSRADELDTMARNALDQLLAMDAKGAQQWATRRKPFRSAYKRRAGWY